MVKIGTCSWKYDSWRGLVYSEIGEKNYLREYARKYDTVEIDQWFWSLFDQEQAKLPDEKTVQDYAESVPEDFKFTIKVPNSITLTHFYSRNRNASLKENPHFLSVPLMKAFLETITLLRDKLDALIFQFEYLNRKKMKSQQGFQQQFARFISDCPDGYPYALENRNPNFLNQQYFEFIERTNLNAVFIQGYYMPDIYPVYLQFQDLISGTVIIRLMGRDRKKIESKTSKQWNRIVEPKDKDLINISDMIKKLESKSIEVIVNVNNHYEGSAPLTINKIVDLLD